jgi:nucleoid DNA-binding protein
MRKTELTKKIAKQMGVTRAEAADQLDRVVADILRNLRKGESAQLPGLGEFSAGPGSHFEFKTKDDSRGE